MPKKLVQIMGQSNYLDDLSRKRSAKGLMFYRLTEGLMSNAAITPRQQ